MSFPPNRARKGAEKEAQRMSVPSTSDAALQDTPSDTSSPARGSQLGSHSEHTHLCTESALGSYRDLRASSAYVDPRRPPGDSSGATALGGKAARGNLTRGIAAAALSIPSSLRQGSRQDDDTFYAPPPPPPPRLGQQVVAMHPRNLSHQTGSQSPFETPSSLAPGDDKAPQDRQPVVYGAFSTPRSGVAAGSPAADPPTGSGLVQALALPRQGKFYSGPSPQDPQRSVARSRGYLTTAHGASPSFPGPRTPPHELPETDSRRHPRLLAQGVKHMAPAPPPLLLHLSGGTARYGVANQEQQQQQRGDEHISPRPGGMPTPLIAQPPRVARHNMPQASTTAPLAGDRALQHASAQPPHAVSGRLDPLRPHTRLVHSRLEAATSLQQIQLPAFSEVDAAAVRGSLRGATQQGAVTQPPPTPPPPPPPQSLFGSRQTTRRARPPAGATGSTRQAGPGTAALSPPSPPPPLAPLQPAGRGASASPTIGAPSSFDAQSAGSVASAGSTGQSAAGGGFGGTATSGPMGGAPVSAGGGAGSGSGSGGGGGHRPKKMLHREVEQARRSRMAAQIERLRAQLAPDKTKAKADKVSVLQGAVAFIARVNERESVLRKELEAERAESTRLRNALRALTHPEATETAAGRKADLVTTASVGEVSGAYPAGSDRSAPGMSAVGLPGFYEMIGKDSGGASGRDKRGSTSTWDVLGTGDGLGDEAGAELSDVDEDGDTNDSADGRGEGISERVDPAIKGMVTVIGDSGEVPSVVQTVPDRSGELESWHGERAKDLHPAKRLRRQSAEDPPFAMRSIGDGEHRVGCDTVSSAGLPGNAAEDLALPTIQLHPLQFPSPTSTAFATEVEGRTGRSTFETGMQNLTEFEHSDTHRPTDYSAQPQHHHLERTQSRPPMFSGISHDAGRQPHPLHPSRPQWEPVPEGGPQTHIKTEKPGTLGASNVDVQRNTISEGNTERSSEEMEVRARDPKNGAS